jgi:predicted adenine nucleotide alpha hydrolase (AANH) superfamily ATPase
MDKPRLLAHICCAPDAAYVIGLLAGNYDVAGFFYNPNIHPRGEYALRLKEARRVANRLGVPLIEDDYDDWRWLRLTEKHKDEPEKGRRCDICYAMRLDRTARAAAAGGFDYFTTIMSLSPWKKAAVLNRIGRMFGRRFGVRFLEADFKKKDGFRKSVELSKSLGLYRQEYCGCLYSRRDQQLRLAKRPLPPPSSPASGGGIRGKSEASHTRGEG